MVKLVYFKKGFYNVCQDLLFQPTAGNKAADYHVWYGMMTIPVVQRPDIVLRSYMRSEKYWKTCRLYRLPVDKANDSSVPLEQWQYIAPQKSAKGHYGLFPIIKYEMLDRKEITQIFEEQNIKIKARSGNEERKYYLFYLGEPISAPDNLMRLPRGKVVTTVEK